jgi:acyl dehydratase
MPIVVERALAAKLREHRTSWISDDVILYHLGLGAGMAHADARELEYVYEARLKVLPTFGILAAAPILQELDKVPGLEIDLALTLHGEQDLEVFGPLPIAASVRTYGQLVEILDKGSGAVIVAELVTEDETGTTLCRHRFSVFARGAGGFGGLRRKALPIASPVGPPDLVIDRSTLPQQALLYRLSGDMNPIHADPEYARRGGFDQPILHGLCTYGMVCKAVVDEVLDGAVERVARYQARFAGPVFPGETLSIALWLARDQVQVQVTIKERGTLVLTHGVITMSG